MKIDKILKFLYPSLALLLLLVSAEISFKIFDDYGRVIPYRDYFFHKRQKVSYVSGELWLKKEYTSTLIRNSNFQHVPTSFDFSPSKKQIFLLGDSIVESGSMRVEDAFYSLLQERTNDLNIVPFHFAGASLKTLVMLMPQYKAFFNYQGKSIKPDLAVLQIRSFSFQGGNTNFFDPKLGKIRDFQDKLPSDLDKSKVIELKDKFLSFFKLDIKFSSKFKDQLFQKAVLGKSRIVSLLAWRIFQWTSRVTAISPRHEKFIVHPDQKEKEYWARFEKTIQMLSLYSKKFDLPVAVLLVPSPEWITEFEYTGKLNAKEEKYQELFAKYSIPFKYANQEFLAFKQKEQKKVFWEDKHPNLLGSKALSFALEELLNKLFAKGVQG